VTVVSKIDSPLARIDDVKIEIATILNIDPETVLGVSGKTGEGVAQLLDEIIRRVPPPADEHPDTKDFRSLVFDFQYSNHQGVIVYVRVMNGHVERHERLQFMIADKRFLALEAGIFTPDNVPVERLGPGEIGYIVTGIKEPGIASVGDTVANEHCRLASLEGYMKPSPMVWASLYPESQDDHTLLRQALGRLSLSDSSYSYEEETSGTLGRGFRCGFLGMLHLEIITERLRREFNLSLVITTPSITYYVTDKQGKVNTIYSPSLFPDDQWVSKVEEPWVSVIIMTPEEYVGKINMLLYDHEGSVTDTHAWNDTRTAVTAEMPLRELMRGFFDKLKSLSSGYASISYTFLGKRDADVVRLDVLVADEPVVPFTRVVARRRLEEEARLAVQKLHQVLPKQLFVVKIQAKALGRIIASEALSSLKRNVTAHLYGGDITRKKKLWEQQKEGKKRLAERGVVNIPQEVFVKMMKLEE
jgi:GTP-binding protein LepA